MYSNEYVEHNNNNNNNVWKRIRTHKTLVLLLRLKAS